MKLSKVVKLKLFSEGLNISSDINYNDMFLKDYVTTSGIILKLDDEEYVNAKINKSSSFTLSCVDDNFFIYNNTDSLAVSIVYPPEFVKNKNIDGEPYSDYVMMHTDRARISPIGGCSSGCKFCNMGGEPIKKNINKLIESLSVALYDPLLPAKHILISGGIPEVKDYTYLNDVYKEVLIEFSPICNVDIMMYPFPDLLNFIDLHDLGCNELSLNMEIYDENLSNYFMPKKSSVSRKKLLDVLESAVNIFGVGKIRSMLLIGLESTDSTLSGVDELLKRGCEPVLSPFIQNDTIQLNGFSSPTYDFLLEVYEKSQELSEKYNIPLGPKCVLCQHNTLTFSE